MFVLIVRHLTLSGSVERHVTCERCQKPFSYLLKRHTAIDTIPLPPLIRQAEQICRQRLARQLAEGAEPVSCSSCNWVQSDMIPELRRRVFRPLATLGMFLAVACAAGALIFLIVALAVDPNSQFAEVNWFGLAGAFLGGSAVAAGMIHLRTLLARLRYAPGGFMRQSPLGHQLLLPHRAAA